MAERWCPYCERKVPVKRPDITGKLILFVLLGFVTCGLAWILMPLLYAEKLNVVCPICGGKTRKLPPPSARQFRNGGQP